MAMFSSAPLIESAQMSEFSKVLDLGVLAG